MDINLFLLIQTLAVFFMLLCHPLFILKVLAFPYNETADALHCQALKITKKAPYYHESSPYDLWAM